jgi:hypothetical protein
MTNDRSDRVSSDSCDRAENDATAKSEPYPLERVSRCAQAIVIATMHEMLKMSPAETPANDKRDDCRNDCCRQCNDV